MGLFRNSCSPWGGAAAFYPPAPDYLCNSKHFARIRGRLWLCVWIEFPFCFSKIMGSFRNLSNSTVDAVAPRPLSAARFRPIIHVLLLYSSRRHRLNPVKALETLAHFSSKGGVTQVSALVRYGAAARWPPERPHRSHFRRKKSSWCPAFT